MNLMEQSEVRRLCRRAGFPKKQAQLASAIAMCESPVKVGGVVYADFGEVGDEDLADGKWGFSYGGFQVRSLRAAQGTGGWRDEDKLLDPLFNCKAALFIKQTEGWDAWSTYRDNMHIAYLQDLFPPPVDENGYPTEHLVRFGEFLSTIALNYDWFKWEELARFNGLHSPYSLRIGQILKLPPRPV